jgi:hypothetical protein
MTIKFTETEYNQLVKMYKALKTINETMDKLPGAIKISLDFSCIMATRDALKFWDKTDEPDSTFMEILTASIAEAQYNMTEIIMKQQEEQQEKNQ